jgi:hypothetical protein
MVKCGFGFRNPIVTFYDTVLHTEFEVTQKYPCAMANLVFLRGELGTKRLVFGVDATALNKNLGVFDIVFFYFPHTGVTGPQKTTQCSNQALLRGFFACVYKVLKPGGEVQVALSTSPLYTNWDIKSLVPEHMVVTSEVALNKIQLPGIGYR